MIVSGTRDETNGRFNRIDWQASTASDELLLNELMMFMLMCKHGEEITVSSPGRSFVYKFETRDETGFKEEKGEDR